MWYACVSKRPFLDKHTRFPSRRVPPRTLLRLAAHMTVLTKKPALVHLSVECLSDILERGATIVYNATNAACLSFLNEVRMRLVRCLCLRVVMVEAEGSHSLLRHDSSTVVILAHSNFDLTRVDVCPLLAEQNTHTRTHSRARAHRLAPDEKEANPVPYHVKEIIVLLFHVHLVFVFFCQSLAIGVVFENIVPRRAQTGAARFLASWRHEQSSPQSGQPYFLPGCERHVFDDADQATQECLNTFVVERLF